MTILILVVIPPLFILFAHHMDRYTLGRQYKNLVWKSNDLCGCRYCREEFIMKHHWGYPK